MAVGAREAEQVPSACCYEHRQGSVSRAWLGLGPGHLVLIAQQVGMPSCTLLASLSSTTYLAQMRLLLEPLQELGVMLLVHQLLLDGLGVLGQGLRAGPPQRFMVAWERQALCRDERGGEGEGDRSQTWDWRGEEGEVRGGIVHRAEPSVHITARSSAVCTPADRLQTALKMTAPSPGARYLVGRDGWAVPLWLLSFCPHRFGITQPTGAWGQNLADLNHLRPPSASSSMGEGSFTAGNTGQGEMEPGTSTKEPVLLLQLEGVT